MLQGQPASSHYEITSSCMDDAALVTGLQRRDPCSVEYVMQHYAPALFRFAYYQLRDVAFAEDVVSEVMVRMIERVGTFRLGEGAFQSWLFRIARNLLTDHYRACQRRPEVSLEQCLETDPASEPGWYDSQIDGLCDRQQILDGLATLTSEQREVILLHLIEGWELPQVAELLERSVPSIKGLYYRGVQSLRRALLRDGDASRPVFIERSDSMAGWVIDD